VRRLAGQGGDPVVQLQTNFGGGKTHSMLALYHLFSGTATSELAGIDAVMLEAGAKKLPSARRVLPIEVKTAARVTPTDAKGLEAFLDEYADLTDGALLLHGDTETFPITRRVLAAPWWRVC
jgi:hypothetical protein